DIITPHPPQLCQFAVSLNIRAAAFDSGFERSFSFIKPLKRLQRSRPDKMRFRRISAFADGTNGGRFGFAEQRKIAQGCCKIMLSDTAQWGGSNGLPVEFERLL